MSRRRALSFFPIILAAALPGCAALSAATTAVANDPTATALWGIAKGIGEVALTGLAIANPPAAALINTAIALVDPLIAAGTADAAVVTAQAHAVLLAAAPAITAVANAS